MTGSEMTESLNGVSIDAVSATPVAGSAVFAASTPEGMLVLFVAFRLAGSEDWSPPIVLLPEVAGELASALTGGVAACAKREAGG